MRIELSLTRSPATPERLLEFTLDLSDLSRGQADAMFNVVFDEARKLLKTAMDQYYQDVERGGAA